MHKKHLTISSEYYNITLRGESMYLTVKDILNMKEFVNCKLISGEDGIGNVITHVNAMEIPDISEWISKGELLITTGYSIKDNPTMLEKLIVHLYKKNCAGLAIKTRFIKKFTPEVIKLSNNLGIPIIHVPNHVKYADLSTPIMKKIVDENNLRYELSQEIHDKFINIELNGAGVEGIADMISDLLNNKVLILDKNFKLINNIKNESYDNYLYVSNYLLKNKELNEKQPLYISINTKYKNYHIRKVYLKENLIAYIVLIDILRYNQIYDIVMDHASMALALEFSKKQSIEDNIIALNNMFFVDLMTNNIKSERAAMIRSNSLNWPKLPYCMILFNIDDFISIMDFKTEYELHILKINIRDRIALELNKSFKNSKVIILSDEFYALISRKNLEIKNLEISIENILSLVKKDINISLTASISNIIQSFSEITIRAIENQRALEICRRKKIKKSYIYTKDTKFDQFILENKSNENLQNFVQENLMPLAKYDLNNSSELCKTLEIYLTSDYNITKSANKLFIHRNTLSYRLNKIEKILNINLNSFESKYNLMIAININKIIKQLNNI